MHRLLNFFEDIGGVFRGMVREFYAPDLIRTRFFYFIISEGISIDTKLNIFIIFKLKNFKMNLSSPFSLSPPFSFFKIGLRKCIWLCIMYSFDFEKKRFSSYLEFFMLFLSEKTQLLRTHLLLLCFIYSSEDLTRISYFLNILSRCLSCL